MLWLRTTVALALSALCTAAPTAAAAHLDPVRTIYQFPKGTFVENLAARKNGEILVSLLTTPELVLFDPNALIPKPVVAHRFADAISVAGIAEYEPDVFAVVVGNFSFASIEATMGSWGIWSVDLRDISIIPGLNQLSCTPRVSKIADLPTAHFLNGMTVLSTANGGSLAVADLLNGVIYRVDIRSQQYSVLVNNTLTAKSPGPLGDGVDGVHVRGKTLFFSNAGKNLFCSVPIHEDGSIAGPFKTIESSFPAPGGFDDFTFDEHGNPYLVTAGANSIETIQPDGSRVIIAGDVNSTQIAEPTSCVFGCGSASNVLYVTTGGGMITPVNGDIVVGGQVLAVTTKTRGKAC